MHYNTSRVDRFTSIKFKSSIKQGATISTKLKPALKTLRKKDSSQSLSRENEDKLKDDTETMIESELSSEVGYVQMKSGKYINPILQKYSSVPSFKL